MQLLKRPRKIHFFRYLKYCRYFKFYGYLYSSQMPYLKRKKIYCVYPKLFSPLQSPEWCMSDPRKINLNEKIFWILSLHINHIKIENNTTDKSFIHFVCLFTFWRLQSWKYLPGQRTKYFKVTQYNIYTVYIHSLLL